MFILEDFQRPPLPALIDRDRVGADAQPEFLGKATFLALGGGQELGQDQISKVRNRTQKPQDGF